MLAYILQTTLIWTLLLVIYKLLLSKEKYFLVNRAYLLTGLILGLILPALQYVQWSSNPMPVEIATVYKTQINYVAQWQSNDTISTPLDTASTIDWMNVLYYTILFGMLFMLIRFIRSLGSIYKLYASGQKIVAQNYTEVVNQKQHLPFSFLRYIFYSFSHIREKDRANIITHELYHVTAKHTWDVLFVEIIKIIFWWNPLPYLYKLAIVENHEYAADAHVIKDASRKQYCSLLLQTNFPELNLPLTHPFFQSFIKKRIQMMYQKKSNPAAYLKIILPLVLMISMAFVITSQDDKIDRELVLECLEKTPKEEYYIKHNNKVIGSKFPANLDTEHFDFIVDDVLLRPNVDYYHYPELSKIVVINPKYINLERSQRCMHAIDAPRTEDYYDKYNSIQDDTPKVDTIRLMEDASISLNHKKITINELETYLSNVLEADAPKPLKIKPGKMNPEHQEAHNLIGKFYASIAADNPYFYDKQIGISQPKQKSQNNNKMSYAIHLDENGIHSIDFENYDLDKLKKWLKHESIAQVNIQFNKNVENEAVVELLDLCYELKIATKLSHPESHEFNIVFLPDHKVSVNKKVMRLESFKEWIIKHDKKPNYKYNVSYDNALSSSEIQSLAAIVQDKRYNTKTIQSDYRIKFNNESAYISECANDVDPFSCSVKTLMLKYSGSKWYTDKLIEQGFEGLLNYSLLIDDKGKLQKVTSHNNLSDLNIEVESIGEKIADDINKNYKFTAAKNEGIYTQGNIPLLVNLKLSSNQENKTLTRDSKSNPENQIKCHVNYITDQGYLGYTIKTNWNVPAHIEITDPTGTLIHKSTIDYIYKEEGAHFFIPNKVNGTYKIKVTQDGQTVETEFLCEVF